MLKSFKVSGAVRRLAGLPLRSSAAISALAFALTPGLVQAQQTFANVTGAVSRSDGGPVSAIKVEITHGPSSTRLLTSVNAQGRFSATGLRVGGPYQLRFFGEGVREEIVEGLQLLPGETQPVNITLEAQLASAEESEEEIVIVGRRVAGFGVEDIAKTPLIDRRLQDVIRLDSSAFVDRGEPENDQGFSILGFNTRFNNLVVDGLSQTDSFGDNFTGLPTRRTPISLDAVESLSVDTAPFDVQNGSFTGGQVNITTRSGGNEFHGSAFFQRSGGFLTGNRAGTNAAGNVATVFATEQPENTWGVTFNGPIIKDRLFFFFSYETFQENDTLGSCPLGVACDNPSELFTLDTYNQIRDISIANFDIDPGDFNDFLSQRDGERRYFGKLDWNISDRHRAAVTVQRTTSNDFSTGSSPGLNTPSAFLTSNANTTGVTAQAFSSWTENFSTQVRIGWRDQRRETSPLFGDGGFGQILIDDIVDLNPLGIATAPPTTLAIGPDDTAQNAIFDARRLQFFLRGEYRAGSHTLAFGYDRDSQRIFNLETPGGRGVFTFGSGIPGLTAIQAFQAGIPETVQVTAPFSGDLNDLAADFTLTRNAFFVQDIWRPTRNLDLLLGLRYERLSQDEVPGLNRFFTAREGISNTATLNGKDVFSPRFQYTWRALDRTTFRGGVGIFAAPPGNGTPITWFAETFSQNGVNLANFTRDNLAAGAPNFSSPNQVVDPNALPQDLLNDLATLGANFPQSAESDVTALDPNFEIPRVLRAQVAFDQDFNVPFLGKDWRFTFEFTQSESLQAIRFTDLRPIQQVVNGQPVFLPDGTPRFISAGPAQGDLRTPISTSTGAAPFRNSIGQALFEQDLLITNTQAGATTSYKIEIAKNWDLAAFGDVGLNLSWSRIRAVDVSPANDTDNVTDVFETGAFSNVLDPAPGFSIQSVPNNFVYRVNWQKSFWKEWQLALNLVGNYRSGRATSLVFNPPASGATAVLPNSVQLLQPGFSATANDRILAALPSGPNDPRFRFQNGATFAELDGLITALGLDDFRGEIVPRNLLRADDTHQIDLGFQLTVPVPGNRGRIVFDGAVENILNVIGRNRGVIRRFNIREDLYVGFFDAATNQFVITDVDTGVPLTSIDEQPVSGGSRYRARLAVRYQF